MIKRVILLSLLVFIATLSWSQSEKLIPGESFHNQSGDTLYIIPMQEVKSLLKSAVSNEINQQKLDLYQKKISLYENRFSLSDSALTIKKLEADYWHEQLLKNDKLLENQRIENLRLIDEKNRIRQSRVYYLIGGLLTGAVIVSL